MWVTLRERAPPTPPAALLSATKLKPRKRNFDTVGRTGLFAKALKSGDWAEAGMMLSASATLAFGNVKATGAAAGEGHDTAQLRGAWYDIGTGRGYLTTCSRK